MAKPLTIQIHKDGVLLEERSFEQSIIKIGRLSSAHLRLEDGRVSRIHAVIEVSPVGDVSITDMGSAEGTTLNGQRITKTTIAEGDEIVLGTTKLLVRMPAVAAAAPQEAAAEAPVEQAPPAGQEVGTAGAVAAAASVAAASVAASAKTGTGSEPAPAAPPEAQSGGVDGNFADAPPHAFQAPAESEPYDVRGFIEGRVDPSPVPDSEHRAIELRFMWGSLNLDIAHIRHKRKVTIGESRKCDFFLTSEDFPVAEFPLIFHDGEYNLNVTPKMEGVISAGERICSLGEAVKDRLAVANPNVDGAYSIRLTPDARAAIQFGGVTVLIRSVVPSKPVVVPFGSQINYSFLNTLLLSIFAHIAFLITAVNFPYDTRLMKDELFTTPNRFAKMILTPPEPPEHNPLLDRLMKQDQAAEAEKHKDDEGKSGLKDMLEKDARSAPKAVDPTDQQLVSQVIQRLGGGESGLSTVFDQTGLGGDIEGALGGLIGSFVGDAGGSGGLGLKGLGGGGGGLSTGTIGMGGIGTRGRAGGLGNYGSGVQGLGKRKESDINISEGDPVIRGALDRELIRRVIHANRAQIRYCYERELQRSAGLHGRIAVRFTIAADGTVSAAIVDQNTMGNQQVATCLVGRLRTWQFPEPKGGGIVIVTYPFVFQQAG